MLNYVAWTCYGVEKTVSKTAEKSFRFALVCVVCCMCHRSRRLFFVVLWMREGHKTDKDMKGGDMGKHPLRPACQT